MLFVLWSGLDLVGASVASVLVTLPGVIAAVATFVAEGAVMPVLALKMAAFNVVGSLVGARLVMLQENRLLKRMLGAILVVLLAKLSWDTFHGGTP